MMNRPSASKPQYDLHRQAADLNTLIAFLARMDVPELTPESLMAACGIEIADLLILLGNGVLYTAEKAAEGFRSGVAREMLIVGGVGHSTGYLRENVRRHPRYHEVEVDDRGEAEILRDLVVRFHNVPADRILIETRSTNCGANAIESRCLLVELGRHPRAIILVQDPTMQLRSFASFQQVWKDNKDVRFLNYPGFVPLLETRDDRLSFRPDSPRGLWGIDRFLALVMGEIPRLTDDEYGYGPRGRGFIAHVDIPTEVAAAYHRLLPVYGKYTRDVA